MKRLTFNVTGCVSQFFSIKLERVDHQTFNIAGPSHRNLFIYPLDDNQMINWNLMEEVPKVTSSYNQRHAFFVFTGYGKINEPLNFFVDIQVKWNVTIIV